MFSFPLRLFSILSVWPTLLGGSACPGFMLSMDETLHVSAVKPYTAAMISVVIVVLDFYWCFAARLLPAVVFLLILLLHHHHHHRFVITVHSFCIISRIGLQFAHSVLPLWYFWIHPSY